MPRKFDIIQDSMISVARGDTANWKMVNKYGRNHDVDTNSVPEDIWGNGGIWQPLPSPQKVTVVSTRELDSASGPGARSVKIIGLNALWQEQIELLPLDGLTHVTSVNEFIRIHQVSVNTCGSLGANVGVITVLGSVNISMQSFIDANYGESASSFYTIPEGVTGFMTNLWVSMNQSTASANATVGLFVRVKADLSDSPLNLKHVYHASSCCGIAKRDFKPYLVISEKTDIILKALGVSNNNTDICVGYDLIMVDN